MIHIFGQFEKNVIVRLHMILFASATSSNDNEFGYKENSGELHRIQAKLQQ